MSIKVTITAGATYRIAGETLESGGQTFQGRLINTIDIEGRAKITDQGNPVREISLMVANPDGFINVATEELWGASVLVDIDSAPETWTGKIRAFSQSGEGVLSLTVTEESLPVFKLPLPDELVRVIDWPDASGRAVNTTVPMVFGGTHADPIRVAGILIDRTNFRYLLCVGEVREIVAVLKNRAAITTGFTTYTGTAGQSPLPGYAYIEFAADPRDPSGNWPEIHADVVGLKLAAASSSVKTKVLNVT
jgi:hypothetical protein